MALLDIDDLKKINDTAGHAAGDAVLSAFGDYCRHAFGREDFVARIGGDEFVALIDAPTHEHAVEHVERLIELVRRAAESPQDSRHLSFSISVGLVTADGPGIRARVTRADAALYVAKRSGRNQLVVEEA